MTPFLPEFAELRPHGVYDAELIAFGDDGRPDFKRPARVTEHLGCSGF
jgi:hypothetical protein